MKEKVITFAKHPLVSGTTIIFLGSNVANAFNFFFNFFMVRNLTPSDYGDLTSLVSLVALSTMPAASIMPMLINFAAKYYAKNEMNHLRGLFFKVSQIAIIVGVLIFMFFLVFSPWIADFFKIKNTLLIIITRFVVLIGYLSVTNSAMLQAKLAFTFISLSNLVGALGKFMFGLLFVFLGLGSIGALWGFLLGYLIPYLLSFLRLEFIFDKTIKKENLSLLELLTYGGPAAVGLFALTSFITTDVLVVKHFYSPEEAGVYAIISLVGRIIFFITAPLNNVMFPLVVQKHAKQENYNNIFLLSLLFVFLPSFILTLFYYAFPVVVLTIFNQQKYIDIITPYLALFAIFISIYSLLSVVTNLLLSIGKTRVYIPLIGGAFLQVVLIWFYHDTFAHVIGVSITIVSLLLVLLLLYYWKIHGKTK